MAELDRFSFKLLADGTRGFPAAADLESLLDVMQQPPQQGWAADLEMTLKLPPVAGWGWRFSLAVWQCPRSDRNPGRWLLKPPPGFFLAARGPARPVAVSDSSLAIGGCSRGSRRRASQCRDQIRLPSRNQSFRKVLAAIRRPQSGQSVEPQKASRLQSGQRVWESGSLRHCASFSRSRYHLVLKRLTGRRPHVELLINNNQQMPARSSAA